VEKNAPGENERVEETLRTGKTGGQAETEI